MGFYFNPDEPKYFPHNFNGKEGLFSARTVKCYLIQTGNEKTKKKDFNESGRLSE